MLLDHYIALVWSCIACLVVWVESSFPQVKALTIEEVRLGRSEPAIVKDFAIKVEGPSKDTTAGDEVTR